MATAGWRGIFPGSPDEWSLIAVGEGFASAAQCTTDSLWQPHEGGLRRPGYGHWRESTSVAGKAFGECGEWRMCLRTTVSRLYKNAMDVHGDLCATRRRVGFIWLLWLPEGLPLPRVPKHYEVEWDYTRFPVCESRKDKQQGHQEEAMHVATFALATRHNAVVAHLTAMAACERGCYVALVCK